MFVQDDAGVIPDWKAKPIWDKQMKPIAENIVYDETADGRTFLVWQPEFSETPDDELARLMDWTAKAALLPLSDNYLAFIRAMLVGMKAEINKRLRRRRAAAQSPGKYPDWRDVNLLALVEDRCGPGRKLGNEYWFVCPWHDDRTPSLHVNPEKRIWHTFCCQKGGGIREWRLSAGAG